MKTILVACVDQNKDTHYPVLNMEGELSALIEVIPELRDSHGLKGLWNNPRVQTILIVFYVPQGESNTLRRRIHGSPITKPTQEHVKTLVTEACELLGVNTHFHTAEEARKIIPLDDNMREIIKEFMKR